MSSTVGSVALAILVRFSVVDILRRDVQQNQQQLSGIIGIKTYKCMNDSKIIAGVIVVLALGHLAFVILDAITIRGVRRIAGKIIQYSSLKFWLTPFLGSCLRISGLRYTRIAVALQLGQCCFMMLCCAFREIRQ
jgi:hypothetical protein